MPIFGSSASGAAGLTKRGVIIPAGSLDNWRAARDSAKLGSSRAEVVAIGDSTTYGTSTPGPYAFSWVAQLRNRAAAAGWADGGVGLVAGQDTAAIMATAVAPFAPSSSFTAGGTGLGSGYNFANSNGIIMSQAGHNALIRGDFSEVRLYVAAPGDSGPFSISVNGAAATNFTVGTGGGFVIKRLTTADGLVAGSASNTVQLTWVSGVNRLDVELLKPTGVTFHRHAVNGAQVGDFIPYDDTVSPFKLSAILGGNNIVNPANIGQILEGSHPTARRVRLALFALGLNDLTAVISSQPSLPRNPYVYESAMEQFVAAARVCGADPVICLPHWKGSFHPHDAGLIARVATGVALSQGCALIDFSEALGGPAANWAAGVQSPGDPHLSVGGYTTIGNYVFDNIINA